MYLKDEKGGIWEWLVKLRIGVCKGLGIFLDLILIDDKGRHIWDGHRICLVLIYFWDFSWSRGRRFRCFHGLCGMLLFEGKLLRWMVNKALVFLIWFVRNASSCCWWSESLCFSFSYCCLLAKALLKIRICDRQELK